MSKFTGKVGIIGNGSWGTALAKILTDNGQKIHWWIRNTDAVSHLKTRHHNPHYLTSVTFPAGTIYPTNNLNELFDTCDTIIFCVPAAYSQEILQLITKEMLVGKIIVSAIKGILPFSNQLLNDYLVSEREFDLNRYVSITGPCHAEEVASERLSYLTFSSIDQNLASTTASLFQNEYLHTTFNHDIWGAQYASVLKNIYAIGAGIAHGLDYGDNFLSVYITNCYREMYLFLEQHFDKVHPSDIHPDFHTSAYLGDLLVTGYSLHSRNRRFGMMIGKGYSVEAAILEMNMVAEGYHAAQCMQVISKVYQIDLPIATCIYQILWERKNAQHVFKQIEHMLS